MRRQDLYADPLLYDVLHAPGTREERRLLERVAARHGARGGAWLEPACGTARLLRDAAAAGIHVVGFDREPGMIAFAREALERRGHAGRAELFVADMTDFLPQLGRRRVALAFNLINSIRHLPSDSAMLAHFEQVARALRPGGIYVVGVHLCGYERERPAVESWVGQRGGLRVWQEVRYRPPRGPADRRRREEEVVSRMTVTRPSGVERIESRYMLRTYSPRQWSRLLRDSALELVEVIDEQVQPVEPVAGEYALYVLQARCEGAPGRPSAERRR